MAQAKRDNNQVTTLLAVSNVDGTTPVVLWADPTTHRLLVSATPGALDDLTDVVITSGAQGDILYFNGTNWVNLAAGNSGEFLKTQGAGANPVWASTSATVPTQITVANEATDTTCFPLFVTAATGDLGPKTNAGLTFNSNTGALGATSFTGAGTGLTGTAASLTAGAVTNATLTTALTVNGGTLTLTANAANTSVLTIGAGAVSVSGSNTGDQTNISGNAATVTVADEAADTTCFIGFYTAASGSLPGKTNTNMTFNASTGVATFASIVLTTADINGGTVDGATIGGSTPGAITGTTITANTGFMPDADDGAYLGQSGTAFSDLFLASGAVVNFAAGNATITHSSGLLTLNVPLSIGTSNALTAGTIELGHASANTLSASGGVLSIEGVVIPTISSTNTLTNKRITRRLTTTNAPGATPTMNTDNVDVMNFTGLGTAITSMTTNLSGTPSDGDLLEIRFTDDGTGRGITWGASFASTTVTLPTTTVASTMLRVGLEWSSSASKWQCIATA